MGRRPPVSSNRATEDALHFSVQPCRYFLKPPPRYGDCLRQSIGAHLPRRSRDSFYISYAYPGSDYFPPSQSSRTTFQNPGKAPSCAQGLVSWLLMVCRFFWSAIWVWFVSRSRLQCVAPVGCTAHTTTSFSLTATSSPSSGGMRLSSRTGLISPLSKYAAIP